MLATKNILFCHSIFHYTEKNLTAITVVFFVLFFCLFFNHFCVLISCIFYYTIIKMIFVLFFWYYNIHTFIHRYTHLYRQDFSAGTYLYSTLRTNTTQMSCVFFWKTISLSTGNYSTAPFINTIKNVKTFQIKKNNCITFC